MVKRGMLIVTLLLCVAIMSACSSKIDTAIVELPTEGQAVTAENNQQEQESGETLGEKAVGTILQKVRIYYGNEKGTGLKSEEVTISEVSPTAILGLLGRHNIVSIDTKAQSFEEVDVDGKKILKLDLSKQFKDYVSMMGTDGEYIVMAGLTNTFLDAYNADVLELTVTGTILETGHNIYDKPLEFYKMSEESLEENELAYELTEETVTTDKGSIVYPQFINMKNKKLMEQWNESIRDAATSNYQDEEITQYTVNYEITTQNAGMASMILRGECYFIGAAHSIEFKSTFNFDLTTGKNLRLKDYANIDALAECLKNGCGYKLLSESVSNEDLTSYLTNGHIDDYVKLLQNYDYDFSNKNLIPTGFSYIKNDQTLVLVIKVDHAIFDYLEIEIE